MEAYLFEDHKVRVNPVTGKMGGAFTRVGNKVRAWDASLLRDFYNLTKDVEAPVVFDIGASTGSYSLLTTLHPGMQVVAFEPNPPVYRVLSDNLTYSGVIGRVAPYRVALSNTNGKVCLSVPLSLKKSGLATLSEKPLRFKHHSVIEVDARRLDDMRLPPPDFIKIDVEGAELFVLQGAENTIRTSHPTMLIEHHNVNARQMGYDLGQVVDLIEGWGATWEKVGREDIWVHWPSSSRG